MTTYLGQKYYQQAIITKTLKRDNTVQIMLVIWDPLLLTQYNIYIKLHKNHWIGNVLVNDCIQAVYKNIK
jgi:ABC-type proline/glycine betaine transport system substrate-binding protein